MLTSIILSLTMNMSPAEPVDNHLNIEHAGRARGSVRIHDGGQTVEKTGKARGSVRINDNALNIEEAGRARGSVRIQDEHLLIEVVGRARGSIRIQEIEMIKLIKALFVIEPKANPIASKIQIKEVK